ncbi:MAG: hypothetical protein DDT18_01385 [Actinobacteria bacterium]|nr:hypothetical protein [Actinomycetota bacterium]
MGHHPLAHPPLGANILHQLPVAIGFTFDLLSRAAKKHLRSPHPWNYGPVLSVAEAKSPVKIFSKIRHHKRFWGAHPFILRSFYGLFGPLRPPKIPQKAGFCGTWASNRHANFQNSRSTPGNSSSTGCLSIAGSIGEYEVDRSRKYPPRGSQVLH